MAIVETLCQPGLKIPRQARGVWYHLGIEKEGIARFRGTILGWCQHKEPGPYSLVSERVADDSLDKCALELLSKKVGDVAFTSDKSQARRLSNEAGDPDQVAQGIPVEPAASGHDHAVSISDQDFVRQRDSSAGWVLKLQKMRGDGQNRLLVQIGTASCHLR